MAVEQNDSANQIRERQWKTKAIGAFIDALIEKRLDWGRENKSPTELNAYVADSFERRITELLPAHRDALISLMNGLKATQFANSGELVETMTRKTTAYIVDHVSLDELEKGIQDHDVATKKWKPLSRGLCYETDDNGRIILRVPQIFLRNAPSFQGLFRLGLRELAKVMKSDPALANAKKVGGTSRLIYAFRVPIEDDGFTLRIVDAKNKIAEAEMDADTFIKTYAPKEDQSPDT